MPQKLDQFLQETTDAGRIPGAVALVVKDGAVSLRKCYGKKRLLPVEEAMAIDTIFDLASLTKLTATWLSTMRLLGEGKLRLTDTLGRHFGDEAGIYAEVTLQHLLTHTAGFPSGLPSRDYIENFGKDRAAIRRGILAQPMAYEAGESEIYSDLGFILLGMICEKVSGVTLDAFAGALWQKMDMRDTMFRPKDLTRVAVTEWNDRLGDYKHGIVHDENGAWLDGVAGSAGAFSTADDLAKFCSMVQADGSYDGKEILKPEWVRASRVNYTPGMPEDRSLGWMVLQNAFGEEIIGHTGYTGTAMYMDQKRGITFILLTNRVHPKREVYAEAMIDVRLEAREILWRELA